MTDTTKDKSKDKRNPLISVETLERGSISHTIEVENDAARVTKSFDRAVRELARETRVKGFRPGKAPRSVLERMYGASVAEQLEQRLVSETIVEALELAEIEPAAEPTIEAGEPTMGSSFKYTARVEIRPTIELPDLSGLPAIRPQVHIEDGEVEERLEALRQSSAPLVEEPEGTEIAHAHTATIDFVGRIDGKLFEGGSSQGVSIEIGAERFIPGFEEQLIGALAGDDRELNVTFPEDYGNPDIAGKEAVFLAHIVDVRSRQVPELNDDFAKDMGEFESLDALRERVRSDLVSGAERESKQTFRKTLLDGLLERIEFDVPLGMVERQLEGQLSEAHRRMEKQLDHDAIHSQLDRWREDWRPQAEREVRELIVLEAVADAQSIQVEPDEVAARLEELIGEGDSSGGRLEQLRGDERLMASIQARLREDKVLDFLGSQAKIDENSNT
ncbi:MAG: trigger factor [Myxococcota bacterium]